MAKQIFAKFGQIVLPPFDFDQDAGGDIANSSGQAMSNRKPVNVGAKTDSLNLSANQQARGHGWRRWNGNR